MTHGRVNAAKFIARKLPEPYETALGGADPEATHWLLATAHADWCCPPSGHSIPWRDCYDSADILPLPQKAHLFVDEAGHARRIPAHLTGDGLERARAAVDVAVRIRMDAQGMPLGNQG